MNIKKLINWKLYFILLTASFLSILAVLPYIITLQGDSLKTAPLPFPLIILIIILQSIILFAVFIFIGLKLSNKLELRIPIIEKLFSQDKIEVNVKSIVKTSVLLGLLVGIIIVLLNFLFSQLGLENLFKQVSVPIWQGFLASFYGGISEEIVMRLFLMTFIIWIFSKFTKTKAIENNILVWSSILIAAIIFGIGHLPITGELTTITPLVITRAIVLNGVGGLVFGWLYWQKGLESAMIAHFSADIVLHVLLPIFLTM